jgi:hypothetical protein
MNIDPDALSRYDEPDEEDIYAGLPWNDAARFCGHPGMVWYAKVTKTRGADLKIGDWLDNLDHCGGRMIVGMYLGAVPDEADENADEWVPGLDVDPNLRTVIFTGGAGEVIRADVEYDVVDPDSQVTPDGTPVAPPASTASRA